MKRLILVLTVTAMMLLGSALPVLARDDEPRCDWAYQPADGDELQADWCYWPHWG